MKVCSGEKIYSKALKLACYNIVKDSLGKDYDYVPVIIIDTKAEELAEQYYREAEKILQEE